MYSFKIILKLSKYLKDYSNASAIYAAAKVEKIKAWTDPANNPNNIIGNGIRSGTKDVKTETVSSSAKTFPNNRKLNDKGFVKSSNMFIGSNTGIGST